MGAQPVSCTEDRFPGVKRPEPIDLVPQLRMSGATPPLTDAFTAYTGNFKYYCGTCLETLGEQ